MPAARFAADADAVAHVVLPGMTGDAPADELTDDLVVGGADGHHLERVRRLHPGEAVTVADGRGRWRPYDVAATGAGRLELVATGRVVVEPRLEPEVTLAFSLTKGTHPEQVVRQATELGVDRLVPVVAARSVARWKGDRAAAGVERLARIAREAAGQCRRARLPVVAAPAPLASLADADGLLVADRTGTDAGAVPLPAGGQWVVVIGPEGGFDATELAVLDRSPRLAVGPHVLRAETAAVAALAALAGRRVAR